MSLCSISWKLPELPSFRLSYQLISTSGTIEFVQHLIRTHLDLEVAMIWRYNTVVILIAERNKHFTVMHIFLVYNAFNEQRHLYINVRKVVAHRDSTVYNAFNAQRHLCIYGRKVVLSVKYMPLSTGECHTMNYCKWRRSTHIKIVLTVAFFEG